MTPHLPRLPQSVPMTPISPGDVAMIAEMLKGYLTFVRFAYQPSAQRDMYMQYVERLRQRLAGQHQENTLSPRHFYLPLKRVVKRDGECRRR